MKTVLGCIRRADEDFHLIEAGDRVAVGVSGGKDSLLLLYALSLYRRFCKTPFTLKALTLTMGIEPFDTEPVRAFCEKIDVPYVVKETDIAHVVFVDRKEKNPCALCANLRRGALNNLAVSEGCNVVALGHHRDDALETLLLSLLYEGRFHVFHPKTHLSRSGVTVIRPMVYLPEKHVIHMARQLELPIIKSPCPANGKTQREEMKHLLDALCKRFPDAREKLAAALRNPDQYGLWEHEEDPTRRR